MGWWSSLRCTFQTNTYTRCAMCPTEQVRMDFGTYKPNVSTIWWDTTHHNYNDFFLELILQFFIELFWFIVSIVFRSKLNQLNRSLYPNIYAASLRHLIVQCSSVSFILTSSYRGDAFTFLSSYSQPYSIIWFYLKILLFDVSRALHLVGGMSHLYIFLHASLGHVVFCWGLDSKYLFSKSHDTREYCPDTTWSKYLPNIFRKVFDIGQERL